MDTHYQGHGILPGTPMGPRNTQRPWGLATLPLRPWVPCRLQTALVTSAPGPLFQAPFLSTRVLPCTPSSSLGPPPSTLGCLWVPQPLSFRGPSSPDVRSRVRRGPTVSPRGRARIWPDGSRNPNKQCYSKRRRPQSQAHQKPSQVKRYELAGETGCRAAMQMLLHIPRPRPPKQATAAGLLQSPSSGWSLVSSALRCPEDSSSHFPTPGGQNHRLLGVDCAPDKTRRRGKSRRGKKTPASVVHWPGIEPGSPAWEARILPLNHQCSAWLGALTHLREESPEPWPRAPRPRNYKFQNRLTALSFEDRVWHTARHSKERLAKETGNLATARSGDIQLKISKYQFCLLTPQLW